MLLIEAKMSVIDIILKVIDTVVWPGTILVIILLFRKKFGSAMDRLGSFEASATGVSMSFEPKLDQAKKLFNELKPGGVKKSAVGIQGLDHMEKSPMEQVMELRREIIKTVHELATENNVDTFDRSTAALCAELANKGVISKDNATLLSTLMNVLDSATPNITAVQVAEIRDMYNAI